MTYRCVFPGCGYETGERRLIEFHHINPRELGPRLNSRVTIPLCPTHHKMIYHPEATSGQHSHCEPGSMTVVQVATTTTGKAVIFRDMSGYEITVSVDSRPPKPYAIYVLSWDAVHGVAECEVDDCDTAVQMQVDSKGYCQVGGTIYHNIGHADVARDLLKAHITQYMTRTKAEHEALLEKARKDYLSL